MPKIGEFFFGSKDKVKQASTMLPQQREAFENFYSGNSIADNPLYGAGQDYLTNLLSGNQNATSEFNAPYLQQFQQQIVPGLSERFAGMGTGAGGLNSSGFNQTIAQAGSGLQSTLAALRQQLLGQASQQALGYAQQPYSNLLQSFGVQPFENIYRPGSPGLLGGVAQGLASGFGQGFGQAAGKGIAGGYSIGEPGA